MRFFTALCFATALAACSPATAPAPEAAPAETAAAPETAVATVTAPTANARVTSPLAVTGIAPAGWYFENQFPVQLVDAQGQVLAEGPATPRVNWTENAEPKAFDATLTFSVTTETPATLVLAKDMNEEGQAPTEVRIPVVLAPAG